MWAIQDNGPAYVVPTPYDPGAIQESYPLPGSTTVTIQGTHAFQVHEALILTALDNERIVLDTDVQNQMKIAIEDELFRIKDAHDLKLEFDTIDRILDRCIEVAKRRMP